MSGQVIVEMSSDEAKLYRGMARLIAQQGKMEKGFKQSRNESEKLDAAGQKMLKGMTAGFVGVGAATGAALKLLREYNAEVDRSAERQRAGLRGLGSLGQIAEDEQDYRRLLNMAKSIFAEGGAKDYESAGRLAFALRSAGADEERELFSKAFARGLVDDPALLASSAKTLMAALGREETGNFRDLVSKSIAAATNAPVDAASVSAGAARAGGAAMMLGLSDEKLLAATSVLSNITGSAEQAGTQVKSLLLSLDKAGGFKGKELREALLEIRGAGMQGKELQKFFGREEALAGYQGLIANLDTGDFAYDPTLRSIRQAQRDRLVLRKLDLPLSDPTTGAAIAAIEASQEYIGQRDDKVASARNVRKALIDEMSTMKDAAGRSWVNQFISRQLLWSMASGEGDEAFIDRYESFASPRLQRQIRLLRDEGEIRENTDPTLDAALMRNVVEPLREAAEKIAEAADKMQQSNDGPGGRRRMSTHTE